HGSYYSIGYIDDYGALKKVDVQCTGMAQCKLTERKIDKDAKAR
ncbi:fimbrial assembly protein, partial [Enterobacter hormaechei]|nr:fimbrial assembly protein [Enterobacter hormaechei]